MRPFAFATLALLASFGVSAQEAPGPAAAEPAPKLPIREITVFKDGHALLLHEGTMPTDAAGNVAIDGLPIPVIGTFWPYSSDPDAKLTSVVAGRRQVRVEKPAVSVLELLQANLGAQVYLTLKNREILAGTLLSLPRRRVEEPPPAEPGTFLAPPLPPVPLLLLKTLEGMKTVALDSIDHVTFRDKSETSFAEEESRVGLTLRLDWAGKPPARTARVGMMYVQKGIRWIPEYRVELDGKGRATVRLQATLINELADLEDVTAHLVIGVPSFAFKETSDPISLQRGLAPLSRHFQQDSQTAYAFGNAIMSQSARMGERRAPFNPAPAEGNPAAPEEGSKEDLFVFPVKHVSLKKGECMVVPVAEFATDSKDVYTLDIPITPPREVQAQMASEQQAELARLFHAPKVLHKIRLTNGTQAPFTTAPALILLGGQVLAQGMMTYTSIGGTTNLEITVAVDIQVKKTEMENERTPNALRWRGDSYQRVDLEGKISLANYRPTAVEVEVTRHILGECGQIGAGGKVEKVNQMEDGKGIGYPDYHWWYYRWWWWNEVNPVSRLTWKVTLEPGKSVDLPYAWHHFWR